MLYVIKSEVSFSLTHLVCSSWSLPGAIWVPGRKSSGLVKMEILSGRWTNNIRFFESRLQCRRFSTKFSWSSIRRSICRSGRCSTMDQCGSICVWFLSARSRVTWPHVIVSSTSNDFEAPSALNAFTNSRLTEACSSFCKASCILAFLELSNCAIKK